MSGTALRGTLHIGSALALKADLFVTVDVRQHTAAIPTGLRVAQV